MTPHLYDDLERDEGLRLKAYQDTLGLWTIGYGHRPASPGEAWTRQQATNTLYMDVALAARDLDVAILWWRNLDNVRQDVLCEMTFNMGIGRAPTPTDRGKGLLSFVHTLAYIHAKEFTSAAAAMLASKWATQVGQRAVRLAFMMRTGARP